MSSPPVPSRRSVRRPIPALILLLVLALLAVGVWWKVLQRHDESLAAEPDPCATVTGSPNDVDPSLVQVRVYNASFEDGLAARVGVELGKRGMKVTDVGNDPSRAQVEGIGQVRYGISGTNQATFVAANFPGLSLVLDSRTDSVVDVVLGPDFLGMVPPKQVPAALATTEAAASASRAANC